MASGEQLDRAVRTLALILLAVLLAAVAGWFLAKILVVVIVLSGAVFFAYLIYPLVRRFSRRLPRWLAIVCVYALLAVGLGLIFAFVGPRIASEAHTFAHDFPGLMQQAQNAILNANTAVIAAVPIEAREAAVKILSQAGTALQNGAGAIAAQALRILLNVASIVTGLVIIPILTFYLLMDLDRLRAGLLRVIPSGHRAAALLVLQDIDAVLGGFIRGQVIVGAIIAVIVTSMLLVLRIKYAFLIGLFAGVVDIIPYVGAIAGAIPAVIIALFTHGFGWAALVGAGFVAMYQLEGHVIAPNIVGQRVGLTPLMVIVAILIGAELGGILGMFVAVPAAGIIKALWLRFLVLGAREGVAEEKRI